MKLIIFGVGRYYEERKKELFQLSKKIQLVAFLDNNPRYSILDGVKVFYPSVITELDYDIILLGRVE